MEVCSKCGAENIDEARYCEACGADLSETEEPAEESGEVNAEAAPAAASPGALREQIPFLTGAVEQARARLENWKQRGERGRQEKVRQEEAARQEQEQRAATTRRSLSGIWPFLVGMLALAAFIYLLIRLPRRGFSPAAAWILLEEIQQTLREHFGLQEQAPAREQIESRSP